MKIEIDSPEFTSKSGTNARGPWEIRTQLGYLDVGKRYPQELKIRLKEGAAPYAPGSYEVDLAKSSYVGKYGSLALSEELVLLPLSPPKPSARAVG